MVESENYPRKLPSSPVSDRAECAVLQPSISTEAAAAAGVSADGEPAETGIDAAEGPASVPAGGKCLVEIFSWGLFNRVDFYFKRIGFFLGGDVD